VLKAFRLCILTDHFSVSRQDLEGSNWTDDGSASDESFENVIKEKLNDIELEFVDTIRTEVKANNDSSHSENGDLEFRLFTGPNITALSRIKISSPDLDDSPPAFVHPNRPDSYYFRGDLSSEQMRAFGACAVSGAEITSRSSIPWPGCSLPWRVINVTHSGKQTSLLSVHSEVNESGEKAKRSRLGKKTRIAKRKRVALKQEQALRKEIALKEKEAHLREKKSMKNRSQKLKRREKKRAEKVAATTAISNVSTELPTGLAT
jgi:hypothetical protein